MKRNENYITEQVDRQVGRREEVECTYSKKIDFLGKYFFFLQKGAKLCDKQRALREICFLAVIKRENDESLRRGGGLKRSSSENVRAAEPDGI